jgi:hypothetical protein
MQPIRPPFRVRLPLLRLIAVVQDISQPIVAGNYNIFEFVSVDFS